MKRAIATVLFLKPPVQLVRHWVSLPTFFSILWPDFFYLHHHPRRCRRCRCRRRRRHRHRHCHRHRHRHNHINIIIVRSRSLTHY